MNRKIASEGEEAIVMKAQCGDEAALESLLAKYHNLAFYIALKICHCDADAEDIVQESFIEVTKSIEKLQEPKYFKAWLNRIIFSKATKLFRGNRDVSMPDQEQLLLQSIKEERRYLLPEKELAFQSDAEILHACVDALPEKMRKMVYLMYFEQMSIKEIAFACDLPEGTVKSRLNYAKKALKESIQRYERENNHKLTFKLHGGIEAALCTLFAKEAANYLPFAAAPKAFSFSFKGHVVEPTMLAVATLGTCATVGAIAVVYPILKENFFSSNDKGVVNQVQNQNPKASSDFPPTVFQGETIKSEKSAYQALTTFAHCEVELQEMDEAQQKEAKALYEAMKQNGGAYYELLKNRNYYK